MIFASTFGGVSAPEQNVQNVQTPAQGGERYMTSSRILTPPPIAKGARTEVPATGEYGTPATVIETIQKSIGESAEGWRMGFAHVSGKAKEAAAIVQREAYESAIGLGYGFHLTGEKIKKGVGDVGESFGDVTSGVGDWFSNVGKSISSFQWLLYVVVAVLIFVAIMVSIGYSGVGGPAARVAEREYVKRS